MRLFLRKYRILLVACIFLLIFTQFVFHPFERLVLPIIDPIRVSLSSTSSGILSYLHTDTNQLRERNSYLEKELEAILAENSRLRLYKSEYQTLKEQLAFKETLPWDQEILLASITGIDANNPSIFYLDKGANDDVQAGYPIITENGVIVGKITESYTESSQGEFLTDLKSLISATIQSEEEITQLVAGEHGLSLRMKFIPQTLDIQKGDTVITSGIEKFIPRGLLIGYIEEIITIPNDPFQEAFLKSPVDYKELSIVSILKP